MIVPAVVVLAPALAGTVDAGRLGNRPDRIGQSAREYAKYTCLEQELHRSVPAGSLVTVVSRSALGQQRLTELATPWLRVTTDRSRARYLLDLQRREGACEGFDLLVLPQ